MLNSKLSRIALVAAAALLAGSQAFAADTANLQLTATVNGVCKLYGASTMTFSNPTGSGAIDPTGADATGSSTVKYRCTKGLAPSAFTIGGDAAATGHTGSLAAQTSGNTDSLGYSLSWTNPTTVGAGMGSGNDISVTVNGTILATQFVNATADTYKATVVVSISP
jgi:hypothetical protein